MLLRKIRTIHRNQQHRARATGGMFTRGNGPSTLEITIFMDIAGNPGPMFKLSTHRSCKDRCAPDLHILHNQTITYSRSLLFAIRRLGRGVASCATLAKNVFFPEVSRFSWR